METTVKLRYIKQSAKKVRFVLNTIKGSSVGNALNKLDNLNKKAAVVSFLDGKAAIESAPTPTVSASVISYVAMIYLP